MKIEELPSSVHTQLLIISGALNLPMPSDFESVEHFLNEVLNRISQAKSLARQSLRNLGDD